MTSPVEFPTRSALSRTFSLDFFRLAAYLIMMLSFLLPLGPIFTAESSRKVFQHQRIFQCAFVFPETWVSQNMGTRVLGMRDLTYPTGTSTQICRPHSYKKSNHDFPDGINRNFKTSLKRIRSAYLYFTLLIS